MKGMLDFTVKFGVYFSRKVAKLQSCKYSADYKINYL